MTPLTSIAVKRRSHTRYRGIGWFSSIWSEQRSQKREREREKGGGLTLRATDRNCDAPDGDVSSVERGKLVVSRYLLGHGRTEDDATFLVNL